MTTKFDKYSRLFAKWAKILIKIDEKHVFGQWNYMGVVSSIPVVSSRHRLMEACHVH